MAINTFFFIARPGIYYRSVGKHGTPLVWNKENVAVTLPTLFVFERSIRFLALQRVVVGIRVLCEMDEDIFYSMGCFRVEKIYGIVGGRQMTVHAISDKPLGVVGVSRCFPGIISKLNLMAGGAELGRRCPDHGVIAKAEKRKRDNQSDTDKDSGNDIFFHGFSSFLMESLLII